MYSFLSFQNIMVKKLYKIKVNYFNKLSFVFLEKKAVIRLCSFWVAMG